MQTANLARAREVLAQAIESHCASAARTVTHVQENVPQDSLFPTSLVGFHADEERGVVLLDRVVDETMRNPLGPLTRHALGQACSRVGFPAGYASEVMEKRGTVGAAVVADALSRLWRADAVPGKRILTRSVTGRVHAILSDKYRRIDCRPIVEAFCAAAAAEGAVPYEGLVTDTRISIKALLPEVFAVGAPGGWQDVVALGVGLTNSDFGAAANSAYAFLLRVMCVNGMTGEKVYSQRHLGGVLNEDDFYSQRTYRLDAATQTSASRDVVRALLGAEGRQRTLASIERAASTNINLDDEMGSLKKALTKGELATVTAALQSVNEEEMPLGPPSPYRMANALSWAASKAEDGDRKMELQKLAGGYVGIGKAA